MNLSNIPFLIHWVLYDVGPPFAAITASSLWEGFRQGLGVCLWEAPEAHL